MSIFKMLIFVSLHQISQHQKKKEKKKNQQSTCICYNLVQDENSWLCSATASMQNHPYQLETPSQYIVLAIYLILLKWYNTKKHQANKTDGIMVFYSSIIVLNHIFQA